MKTTISIKGIHCASCKTLIEDISTDISGITLCNVDIKSGKAMVEHASADDIKKLKQEIEAAGDYKVALYHG